MKLSAAHPGDRVYEMDVVEDWIAIGNIQRQNGDSQNAGQSFDHARDIIQALLEAQAEDSQLKGQLARVLERKAGVLDDLGRSDDALAPLNQAVELARASLKTAEDGKRPREYLSEAHWNLARLLSERGQGNAASQHDEKRIALWKGRPVTEIVDLATKLAVRADVIGYGETSVPAAGQNVRKLDRDQAAANLQLAIKGGFKDLARLKANRDLLPLLDREDLKPLVERLSLPDKPSEK